MPATNEEVTADFLTSLRQATAREHALLESTPLSTRLLSADITIHDYTSYLLRMKSIICFSEDNIFPLIKDIITDIDKRYKCAYINSDLHYFNIQTNATNNTFRPVINSIPAALGFMYVTEGSILGGRIILKHVTAKLTVDAEKGGRFFAGYNNTTSSLWKEFLQLLSAYVHVTHSGEAVIKGAQHAFQSIYEYFSISADEN